MSDEFQKLTRHEKFVNSIQNAVTFIMAAGLTFISIGIAFFLLINNPTGLLSPEVMFFVYTFAGVGALLLGAGLNRKFFDSRKSKPDVFHTTPELSKHPEFFTITVSATRSEKMLENNDDTAIDGVIIRAVEELEKNGLIVRMAHLASSNGIKTIR